MPRDPLDELDLTHNTPLGKPSDLLTDAEYDEATRFSEGFDPRAHGMVPKRKPGGGTRIGGTKDLI